MSNRWKPKNPSGHTWRRPGAAPKADWSDAPMRFHCSTCGTRYTSQQTVLIGEIFLQNLDTGEEFPLQGGAWRAACPVCGVENSAINQVTVVGDDNTSLTGFADNPSEFAALRHELEKLRESKKVLSLDEVADALESRFGAWDSGRGVVTEPQGRT